MELCLIVVLLYDQLSGQSRNRYQIFASLRYFVALKNRFTALRLINTRGGREMATYLLPKARNTVTGQTQKLQNLDGYHIPPRQRALALEQADQLASGLTDRTGEVWEGYVVEYTPSVRKAV